jgi:hypothetical protein
MVVKWATIHTLHEKINIMTKLLEIAKLWLSRGIAVIPIIYKDKKPAVAWKPYVQTLPTEQELKSWFINDLSNYAIICGWRNLAVIDFDTVSEYAQWRLWAADQGGAAKMISELAYRVTTARGMHVYIRLLESMRTLKIPNRLDVKCSGGYVLGAGSIHPSGAEYTAMNEIILPMVRTLSEVLPAEILSNAEIEVCKVPSSFKPASRSNDPYKDAMIDNQAPGQDLITHIRQAVRIEDFFTDLEKSGTKHLMSWCPFHDDQPGTRSFWIDTDLQICGCFKGCTGAKPLDVINLFARLQGLTNQQAILSMARRL